MKKITKYAEEGEWRAQFELGLVHEKMKDYDGAIRWYEQASSNGSSGAMRNIGLIFYYGKGRGVDYQKAYECAEIAAAHGVAEGELIQERTIRKIRMVASYSNSFWRCRIQ